jgi:Gpi18-like mannosyltransferase
MKPLGLVLKARRMITHNKDTSSRKNRFENQPLATLLPLWLILRVLASLWVVLVSPLRPFTEIEKTVPIWPPASPLTVWANRILISPWQHWDALWYEKIAVQGYRLDDGTAQFHPLYPWFAVPFTRLGLHPILSLLWISSIFSILLMLSFERLARLDTTPEISRSSAILFFTFPMSVIFFAPYSEALFLTWAVLCFLWARQHKWWLAGIAGALATLTRQQGIFLTIPLAWELWEASGYSIRQILRNWRNICALVTIPIGLIVWLFYRAVALSDLSVKLHDFNSLVYSFLISPSASQVVPMQRFTWPWTAIGIAVEKLLSAPDIDIAVNIFLALWFLAVLGLAWHGMRTSYKLFCLTVTLVSFSYTTGPIHPYMGLPRHLLLAFPIFLTLAYRISRPWIRLLTTMFGLAGMTLLLFLYVLEAWVP